MIAPFRHWNGLPESRRSCDPVMRLRRAKTVWPNFKSAIACRREKWRPPGRRTEYFPVFFVEPLKGNERALGFDLASDPVRRDALQNAADSGRMTASGRLVLVQEKGDQYGFLVILPCYRGGVDPSGTERRRNKLVGFVLGVFRMKDVVENTLSDAAAVSGLGLAVFDRDAPAGQRLLYPKGAGFDGVGDLPKGPVETYTMPVAGRTWEVAAYPLPHAFSPVRWSSWSILAAELIVVIISVTYLYLMLHNRQAIERTVGERTEALRSAVEELGYTKKAAEESEMRYRKLLEVSPDAILLGRNGKILMANEAAVKLFRASGANDLTGRGLEDFAAPDSQAEAEAVSRSLFSGEEQLPHRELRLQCGREVVDVEIAAASYLDDEGATVQFVIRDITERRRAEQVLRLSEARLRGITDSARDAIVMMDPRGAITYWNPAAQGILGYRKEEAVGKNLHLLLVPERYLEAHHAAFPEFLRTGTGNVIDKTVELPARHKDGREISVDLSLSAILLDGEWHAIAIMRDITERKETEQALRDSEEKFRQLAENIREVFYRDRSGNQPDVYVSPGYERIWGKSRDSIYRDPMAWQESVHPEDLEQTSLMAAKVHVGEPVEIEYRILDSRRVGEVDPKPVVPRAGARGIDSNCRDCGRDYRPKAIRGGIDPGPGKRRSRQPRKEYVSGHHEPRVADAAQCHPGFRRASGAGDGGGRDSRLGCRHTEDPASRQSPAGAHQRCDGLFQDRSRQDRTTAGSLQHH